MSELTTTESSDPDLDPISESASKTLDEDEHESSSENDETLEEDLVSDNKETLDTANANLDFRSIDVENNIPVSSKKDFWVKQIHTYRYYLYVRIYVNWQIYKFSEIQTVQVKREKKGYYSQ